MSFYAADGRSLPELLALSASRLWRVTGVADRGATTAPEVVTAAMAALHWEEAGSWTRQPTRPRWNAVMVSCPALIS